MIFCLRKNKVFVSLFCDFVFVVVIVLFPVVSWTQGFANAR